MASATRLKQTRPINLKVLRWISCRGKVGVWVDVRGARAEVLEKVKAEARVDPVTADRKLFHRSMSTQ